MITPPHLTDHTASDVIEWTSSGYLVNNKNIDVRMENVGESKVTILNPPSALLLAPAYVVHPLPLASRLHTNLNPLQIKNNTTVLSIPHPATLPIPQSPTPLPVLEDNTTAVISTLSISSIQYASERVFNCSARNYLKDGYRTSHDSINVVVGKILLLF